MAARVLSAVLVAAAPPAADEIAGKLEVRDMRERMLLVLVETTEETP